jgi:hypothetical protein
MAERREGKTRSNPALPPKGVVIDSTPRPTRYRDLSDAQLEERLRIDRFHLEEVCCEHPELFAEVANRLARLISWRDEAKQNLKEAESNFAAKSRHDAEESGEKVVEKRIESETLLDPGVRAVRDKMSQLDLKVGLAAALKEAFHARSYAIRDLIQLYIANYYGSDMEKASGGMRSANANAAREKQREHFRK